MQHPAPPDRPLSLSAQAAAARGAPYLADLNPAQREAVKALDGPVLMLAGAGTGKTKALTARIAHLLSTLRARPNEILAVTFTNKAAREMKDRIGRLMGHPAEGMPWMGTFHSVSVKLLRRHAELVGLKSNFTILDTDDQLRIVRQILDVEGADRKRWTERWFLGLIDYYKNKAWLPDAVPASEDKEFWLAPGAGIPVQQGGDGSKRTVVDVYRLYQDRLRTLNATDFGDLLLHCLTIFRGHPDVLEQYQRWFRYILVDEYQDTNVAQYLWLRLLAQSHHNICCVGDDDQSIYGWRGAEVGNILRFEKDFPGAKVIRLEQNYRSTEHILAAASGLIAGNQDRLGKTLWTETHGGEKVRLIGHWDGEEEARWIGEEVEALRAGSHPAATRRTNPRSSTLTQELDRRVKNDLGPLEEAIAKPGAAQDVHLRKLVRDRIGEEADEQGFGPFPHQFSFNEIVILVRASHQMRAFEDRFLTIGLPYRVIGGPRFYERQEIRDAMAYFRLAVSPEDDLAFERVVNLPKRGLGEKAQADIARIARANQSSYLDAARVAIATGRIAGKGAGALRTFIDNIDRWHAITSLRARPRPADVPDVTRIVPGSDEAFSAFEPEGFDDSVAGGPGPETIEIPTWDYDHIRLAETVLDESGYTEMWQTDKTPEAPGRLDNLKELVKALESFDNLQGFLEHVSLIMDNDAEDATEKVTIMTLHAAKGLEFPVVFLPGWEDGLFPSQRSMDESGLAGLEEERRLAYVGITRAEELATISFAGNRRVYGQWQSALPSRFIDELPSPHVEVLTPPGLYGGGFGAAGMSGGFRGGHGRSTIEERATKADVYNSPGWKRMQERSSQRPIQQPREARHTVIDLDAVTAFDEGDRVFHKKFGYGTVTALEGDKLAVAFDKAGEKHVLAGYVVAADLADDIPF